MCCARAGPKAFGDRLLVKMMELAPEMVAVVFHQGFASPALLRWNRRWLWGKTICHRGKA